MSTAPEQEPPWYSRPAAREWRCLPPPAAAAAAAFHASLPGYQPTPLRELPGLAGELGARRVFVKDESGRLTLSAFKVLGASWAIAQMLTRASGASDGPGASDPAAAGALTVTALRALAARHPAELVTATDGNHGRAVAWMGRQLGLPVSVFIPLGVRQPARAVIAAEGATLIVVAGSYDRAVEEAASYVAAAPGRALVQDTAWPGYEQVPAWIVAGYDTIFREIDAQLDQHGLSGPDLLSVPVGVGSLAQAAVTHYRAAGKATSVLSVEPDTAACVLASLTCGAPRSVPTADTAMAGLNCGTPSSIAWPVLAAGLDAAIAVSDEAAARAGTDLARLGVLAGPTGTASLAGARAALTGPGARWRRAELAVTTSSVVVLLSTEGRATAFDSGD